MRTKSINNLYIKAAIQLLQLPIVMAALLFIPAWTLNYWEAWILITVFFVFVLAITVYLAIKDPELLARRMNVGPRAEKEKTQKVIMFFALISIIAFIIFPAIDYHFGWSDVPVAVVILGNIFVAVGFLIVFFVLRENTYGASTIEVAKDQKVISTGLYAIVRHPMYAGALVMVFGVPLALGSWWGLLMFLVVLAGIIGRLLDEEKYLSENLSGYKEYCLKTRYRLIPSIW